MTHTGPFRPEDESLVARDLPHAVTRPSAHWGTFSNEIDMEAAITTIKTRLRRGWHFEMQPALDTPFCVLTNDAAVALVACCPVGDGVRYIVLAASPDSGTAEKARNEIRDHLTPMFRGG